jgi:glycine hydroxymethyltransferase
VQVAEYVDRAVNIAIDVKKKSGGKLKDFREALAKEVRESQSGIVY